MSKLPEGFKCEESLVVHLEKIFDGEYDIPINAQTEIVVIDAGANVGAFSLWAAGRWPGCTIHAYEPHPETFKTLCENIKLSHEKIIPYNCGLGPKGFVPLYEGVNNSGEASIFPGNAVAKGTGRHVEIIDPLLIPEAHILKMDTEGCEVDILEPLIKVGRKFAAVMFEWHTIEDRRILDTLLSDYVLIKSVVAWHPAIGTANYIHKDFMKHWRP